MGRRHVLKLQWERFGINLEEKLLKKKSTRGGTKSASLGASGTC